MRSAGIHSVSTHSYTWCIFEIAIGRNFALTHGGMREKAAWLLMSVSIFEDDGADMSAIYDASICRGKSKKTRLERVNRKS